jgi:hypothetical protein
VCAADMLDFFCIGAQKCGTTWLFEQLRKHPQIDFPAGKEIHFWDQKHAKGLDWYRSLFEGPSIAGKKCGEITPAYAILAPDMIEECHEKFSNLKLIYIIRNPIERAWSSAKMALARAEMELEEASDQWFIDHFRSRGSTMRGDYETCLRNWLALYPKEQLLVALFDDLVSTPARLIKDCFTHLEVDPEDYDWGNHLKAKVFPTEEHPIPNSLRSELQRIYRPKILSLSGYLGVDLSAWA